MPRRLAILIGNQTFLPESGLESLHGPLNDVAGMERLLGDPERGNFDVRTLSDRPHHEITALIDLFAQARVGSCERRTHRPRQQRHEQSEQTNL